MSSDIKQIITEEIDSRITRLQEHRDDKVLVTGNQYEELNQALSKVIGVPLIKELENLKQFIEKI